MFNKKKGSKKSLKRMVALLLVLIFTVSSMPVLGLDVWNDQPDNGNDIYFATSEESDDSAFEPEAGYGDDYVADEPSYDYGYDYGYNDENKEADYGYEENYDYKDEDEYKSEEEEELPGLNIPIMPTGTLIGPGTVDASDPAMTVGAHITGDIIVDGGTLYLDGDFTITGMVTVQNGGTFTMSNGLITGSANRGVTVTGASTFNMSGGTISGNTSSQSGGGVFVWDATFIMHDGTISGNNAHHGGGVFVQNTSPFEMFGGTISGNNASGDGGGVAVWAGAFFEMHDGIISGNGAGDVGGGVIALGGEFIMHDGTISGNEAGDGGGVGIWTSPMESASFEMHNGTISGNEAGSGGGVLIGGWPNNAGITFEMHGGEISGNEANSAGGGVRVGVIDALFTMTSGTISGNDANTGGGVSVASGSEFTMSGGTISGNDANTGGGMSVGGDGIFNMSGTAQIINNTATIEGGGVSVNGEINMSGGTISGNESFVGGGVSVGVDGELTMSGGTIGGNTATHSGGGMVMHNTGTINLSGTAQITGNTATQNGGGIFVAETHRGNLTIANTVTFSGNTAGSGVQDFGLMAGLTNFPNIRWVGYAAGTNSTPNPSHLINNFDINNSTGLRADWLRLDDAIQTAGVNRVIIHPATASSVTEGQVGDVFNLVIQDSGQTTNIVTVPIPGAVSPDPHAITVSNAVTVEAAAGANIGLLMGTTGRHFIIQGGNVTIGNPDSTGVLTLNGQATVHGQRGGLIVLDSTLTMHDGAVITNSGSSAVDVNVDSTFTMNGGYIIGNITNNQGAGVVIYNGGVFNMVGGEISGNEAGNGGGVAVWDDSEFNMSGGIISGNEAISGGGGVYLHTNSTFTMSGDAVISGNEASWGGGVTADFGSEMIMSGGEISGNTANPGSGMNGGGGVSVGFLSSATFTMSGGYITGNIVDNGNGGGVAVANNGTFTMNGGEISGNTVTHNGGGIYVRHGGTFNMVDGEMSGNEASSGGGVLVADSGSAFTMSGGEISGNTAINGGGVAMIDWSTFTMSDGEISGNTATSPWHGGGGVYLQYESEFTMTGGTISGNEANRGGGVLAGWRDNTFTMSGGVISGNTADLGGGVAVSNNSEFTMSGTAQITGNHADEDGGGIWTSAADYGNLTIANTATFSGNTAGNGIHDFGLTAGLATFPNIRWVGYAAGTNSTPNPSHLINNYDINNVAPLVFEINVWHMVNGNYGSATLFEHQSWPLDSFLATTINRNATGLPYTTRDPFRGLWFNFGTMANHTRDLSGSFAERSTGDNFTSYIDIDWVVPGVAIDPTYINRYLFNIMLGQQFGLPVQYPGITSFNGSIDIFVNFIPNGGDNGPTDMIKEPDRMVTRIGETISWTLRGFHNRSGEAVSNFTVIDMPGRGLNFQSGSLPAFTGGAGITYEIRYRVFGNNTWHVHQTGIDASQPFTFNLPQPGNLYYTEIGFFFGDVPADFGLGNQIVMTFRVGAGAPNNMLQNDFVVRYGNIERPGGSPNDPIVVTPGGGGPGGTIINDPRVALAEIFSPYHNSFIIGTPDGMIRPHGNITRAEVATVLFRLLDDNFRAAQWSQQNRFSDVHMNQWFNNAVSTMANADILYGNPDGTFRPNDSITRAEFAAMIARFFDGIDSSGQNTFTDTSGHWAESYINKLADFGWVRGDGSGHFHPNGLMTRAEASAIINRMLDRVLGSTDDLLDGRTLWPDKTNQNAWYYLYMQEASHSTEFERRANRTLRWTEILPHLDWSVLERPDSRPGDIIMAREQQRNQ